MLSAGLLTVRSSKGADARRRSGEELAGPSGGALDTASVLGGFLDSVLDVSENRGRRPGLEDSAAAISLKELGLNFDKRTQSGFQYSDGKASPRTRQRHLFAPSSN